MREKPGAKSESGHEVLEITLTRETASELKALVRERMWDPALARECFCPPD